MPAAFVGIWLANAGKQSRSGAPQSPVSRSQPRETGPSELWHFGKRRTLKTRARIFRSIHPYAKSKRQLGVYLSAVFCVAVPLAQPARAQEPALRLSRRIALTGVFGRFDHLAIDLAGDRLFIAATGNHSVEAIHLKSDKVLQSIGGLGKPHGLAWVDSKLYVADGTLAELRVYAGSPLALAGSIKLSDAADDMVYDGAAVLSADEDDGQDRPRRAGW